MKRFSFAFNINSLHFNYPSVLPVDRRGDEGANSKQWTPSEPGQFMLVPARCLKVKKAPPQLSEKLSWMGHSGFKKLETKKKKQPSKYLMNLICLSVT